MAHDELQAALEAEIFQRSLAWENRIKSDMVASGFIHALIACGGFYRTPFDARGRALGPYIGYADITKCGTTYVDCGMLESRRPRLLRQYAAALATTYERTIRRLNAVAVVGVPNGGIDLSKDLACELDLIRLCAQKKTVKEGAPGERDQTDFVFERHLVPDGHWKFIQVEDVVNNSTSGDKLARLAKSLGGECVATMCLWNRSVRLHEGPPIFPLIGIPLPQWDRTEIESQGFEVLARPKEPANRARLRECMRTYPFE